MKMMKKLLPVLLCVMMVVAVFAVASYAANGASNVTLAVEKTEVNVGDTFTVTLSYKDMTVKTFSAGITFDPNLVECVSVEGARAGRTGGFLVDEYGDWVKASSMSSVDQATAASKVGIGLASTDDLKYLGSTLFTVTFKAKAAGTATFTSYESTDGTDAFTGQNIETKTVTIKDATPACTHEATKLVPNDNGTHNVVCANTECNHVVTANVTCTGTDDGDCTTAVTCECGNVLTPASGGHSGYYEFAIYEGGADGEYNCAVEIRIYCEVCKKEVDQVTIVRAGEIFEEASCTSVGTKYAIFDFGDLAELAEGCSWKNFELKGEIPDTHEKNNWDEEKGDLTYYWEIPVDPDNHESTTDPIYVNNKNGTHQVWKGCWACKKTIECLAEADPCFDKDFDGICDGCDVKLPCKHETTKLVPNDNGTHNVVCANAECNHVVTANVTCSGTDDGDCTTAVMCACGNVATPASNGHVAGEDDGDCTTAVKCVNCEKNAVEGAKEHAFNSKASNQQNTPADCENAATYFVQCDNCDAVSKQHFVKVGEANGHGSVNGFRYETNNNGTHNVVCQDCSKATAENVTCTDKDGDEKCDLCGYNLHVCAHDHYETTATTHQSICSCGVIISEAPHAVGENGKCVCGAWLFTMNYNGGKDAENVGADFYACYINGTFRFAWNDEACKETYTKDGYVFAGFAYDAEGKSPVQNPTTFDSTVTIYVVWEAEHVCAHSEYKNITATTHQSYCKCGEPVGKEEPHSYDHQKCDFECECGAKYTGWSELVDGEDHTTVYTRYVLNGNVLYGWNEVEGAWYYFNTTTGDRTTGLARVPYPTVEINGVKYGPNAEDKAYWEAHKDTSKYSDAETAMFVFNINGKLVQFTGIVNNRYAVNGMIGWHVGLVEIEGEYYYFKGDVNGGGNIMATGNVYVSRNTTKLEVKLGGIYTFAADGKLCKYNGITKIGEVLYYYDNYRLATDAGMIKNGEGFSYVRSSNEKAGQLVVNRKYWVSKGNGLLAEGMYEFDVNGLIIMENKQEGIVEVDGVYYYYKAGVKQIGAGVVEMKDEQGTTFYIYVKSDGSLATGKYWPTNRNDLLERGEYDWGTDGKYYPGK